MKPFGKHDLKGLGRPRTAIRGNLMGSIGMLIAVVVTLFNKQIVGMEVLLAGLVVGALIGWRFAVKVQMTAMPQMVALLNSFGGIASALVAERPCWRRSTASGTCTPFSS